MLSINIIPKAFMCYANIVKDVGSMDTFYNFSDDYFEYLKLLAKEYPTRQDTFTELINLDGYLASAQGHGTFHE